MSLGKTCTLCALAMATLISCAPDKPPGGTTKMTRLPFGRTPGGEDVALYTLANSKGIRAAITTYGAILVSLEAPDRSGGFEDVVLGFDTLDGYLKRHPYFGATVGRYGNRIAKGRFSLNGVQYTLARNNGENHLHGGVKRFDGAGCKGRVSHRVYLSGIS